MNVSTGLVFDTNTLVFGNKNVFWFIARQAGSQNSVVKTLMSVIGAKGGATVAAAAAATACESHIGSRFRDSTHDIHPFQYCANL